MYINAVSKGTCCIIYFLSRWKHQYNFLFLILRYAVTISGRDKRQWGAMSWWLSSLLWTKLHSYIQVFNWRVAFQINFARALNPVCIRWLSWTCNVRRLSVNKKLEIILFCTQILLCFSIRIKLDHNIRSFMRIIRFFYCRYIFW